MGIGERLRLLRKSHRMSQDELARKSGLSKSAVSILELNNRDPRVKTLRKLLEVFNIPLSQFFAEAETEKKVKFGHADRSLIFEKKDSYKIELLVPFDLNRAMELSLFTFQPYKGFESKYSHQGQEAGLVLEGEVILSIDGADYKVKKGECFYFQANKMHALRNDSSKISKVLCIMTPPTLEFARQRKRYDADGKEQHL